MLSTHAKHDINQVPDDIHYPARGVGITQEQRDFNAPTRQHNSNAHRSTSCPTSKPIFVVLWTPSFTRSMYHSLFLDLKKNKKHWSALFPTGQLYHSQAGLPALCAYRNRR